jgi:anti-sigma B factor antagonist
MSESQVVTLQPHAEVVWATVQRQKLDDAVIAQMQQDVPAAAAQQPGRPVILDVSKVDFVPSEALGALVVLMRGLKKDGHRFILAGLHPEIRTLFSITRMDKLFEIQGNFDEALKAVRAAQ